MLRLAVLAARMIGYETPKSDEENYVSQKSNTIKPTILCHARHKHVPSVCNHYISF